VDGRTPILLDEEYLSKFLTDLVSVVHMTVIMGPEVRHRGSLWVGWIVLAESHCAIHIHHREAHIDCFSCSAYSVDEALAFIIKRLKLHDVMYQIIERPMPDPIGGSDD